VTRLPGGFAPPFGIPIQPAPAILTFLAES
jgi:hypothetical protein